MNFGDSDFKRYDDPARAKRILIEYASGISRAVTMADIQEIFERNCYADDL